MSSPSFDQPEIPIKPGVPGSLGLTPPKPPVEMRDFADSDATRKNIYDNILKAAQNVPAVANNRFSLHLTNPHYADEANFSIADRKKAILRGETLSRKLRGTWQLKDPTGNVLSERLQTIAQVPHMTHQGTYVLNGTEYTLGSQPRLRPGVFSRQKENGEIESHINVMPGKGVSHHYYLEPETGIFKMKMAQSHVPLISVLRAMGASDKEIHKAWGGDDRAQKLLIDNHMKDDPRVVDKLYEKLIGKKGKATSNEERRQEIGQALNNMVLDEEVTSRTLGKPYKNLSKEVGLAASKKLLDISRGEAETDDRDHLAYQHFMGPEDLFAERIGGDKRVLHELLWKATNKGNLDSIPTGVFTKHLHSVLMNSGSGQAGEEIGPLELLDQQTRSNRLGYGGITDSSAIPDESRSIQPSQLGFIDLTRTPESSSVGIDSRVSYSAKKGNDGRIYSPFVDPKTGQTIYKSPQDIADSVIAFPGEMEKGEPLVAAQVKGKTRYISRDKVDYVLPHMEQSFSPLSNLVPMKSAMKGQRAAMASRFIIQALELKNTESPLVRNEVPGSPGKSFEEHYGKYAGAIHAKDQMGQVDKVTPDNITVKYRDGSTEDHQLYNNLVYNRKSFLHNTPSVQIGDTVQPGQLLARSNFTDDKGHVAVGMNMRTAYIPWGGLNYEDAKVISESAAAKLTSGHAYQHNIEWDEKHKRGRKEFISIFPGTYNKNQLSGMDDEGVIKPGTVIKHGDPIILAAKERELSKKQVHASHKGSFSNDSTAWEHHNDGIVTDVEKTNKGVTVAVKTYSPMQIGDKMCFDPETRVLTRAGWKFVNEVTITDEIATLNPVTDILEWQTPTHVWEYDHDGLMYQLVTKQLDMLVTLDHKLWVARPGEAYTAVPAADFYNSSGEWYFKKDCKWLGREKKYQEFQTDGYRSVTQTFNQWPMDDWLEFLGYYIAEGWCSKGGNGGKHVKIGQFRKSPHCVKIEKLLKRLGLRYRYAEPEGRFEINNCWLYDQLVGLGNSYTKLVPTYVQELSTRQLSIFFNAYMDGDGHRGSCWEFSSSSEKLMYDLQLICMKLGWSVRVVKVDRSDNYQKNTHWRGRINRKQLRPKRDKTRKIRSKVTVEELVQYTGKVYCVTVPNHIIYVERRNKSYWSLNSGRYG